MSSNPAQELETTEDSTGATEVAETATEEAQEQTTDTPEEQVVVYEIGGEEVSEETVLAWKKGHMQERDYTQGKQALSERTNRVAIRESEIEAQLESLTAIQSEIDALVVGESVDIDQFEDQTEYLRAKDAQDKKLKSLEGLKEKLVKQQNAHFEQGHRELSDALGWADPVKREADTRLIVGDMKARGVTDAEFNRVTNPKIMAALLDAAKYRELQAKSPETVKRVKEAPKITKPGAPEPAQPKSKASILYPDMN